MLGVESRFDHECDCSEETFWAKINFDEEFNRRLFVDELDFERWSMLSLEENESELRWLVEAAARVNPRVPETFRRFLRHGLSYRETDVFEKKARRCRTFIVPLSMRRRFSITIDSQTVSLGANRCRVEYTIKVVASLFASLGGNSAFGISRVIEEEILRQFMEGFEVRAALTKRFIAEKSLT
jgi:hypothetical protein